VPTGDEKINDDVTVRIYHPKEARIDGKKLPVCVYAHGGGYGETVWCRFLKTYYYYVHNADKDTSDDTNRMRIVYNLFLSHKADPKELDAVGHDLQLE
jgi:hypothetical protein